jgi:hypothetical protein
VIEEELRQFKLDRWLVSGALDGNDRDVDELALRLMERLIERDTIEKSGEVHLQSRRIAISDGLVNFLIVAMLEPMEEFIPPSLVVLIRERLCGTNPDLYKEYLQMQRKRDSLALAAFAFPVGKVSIRKIAKLMKVQPSTVSRWFPNGDFQRELDKFRQAVDKFGLRKRKHTRSGGSD